MLRRQVENVGSRCRSTGTGCTGSRVLVRLVRQGSGMLKVITPALDLAVDVHLRYLLVLAARSADSSLISRHKVRLRASSASRCKPQFNKDMHHRYAQVWARAQVAARGLLGLGMYPLVSSAHASDTNLTSGN